MHMTLTSNVNNVLCSPLPADVTLKGTGANGSILVTPIPPFGPI